MSDFVVRVRGLPWSAKEDDVIRFFGNCTISEEKKGVHFTTGRDGRSTGEAYVELESTEDLDKALDHHKDHMGKRYIEVFKSTRKEMQWVIGKNQPQDDCVVRLRGLPYGCTSQEILDFFDGYEIAPNGIGIITDQMRRTTGEAYIQFMSGDIAQKAREERHMERIGHRYIEIFKSSMMEAENAMNRTNMGGPMRGSGPMGIGPMSGRGMGMGPRGMGMNMGMGGGRPSPYDRPSGGSGGGGGGNFGGMGGGPMRGNVKGGFGGNSGGGGGGMGFGGRRNYDGGFGPVGPNISADNWQSSTGHSVHMRGLPYSALEADILDFLAPLQPVSIHIHRNANDRPTGEADVDFAIHEEAKEAMKKDREKIGTRYIELFLKSSPAGKMGGGGGIGSSGFQQSTGYQQGYQQGAGGHCGWGDGGDYQDDMGYGMGGGMMGPGMNNMSGSGMNNMGGGMNMGSSGMNNMAGGGMNNMAGGGMNNMAGGGMNNMAGGGANMNNMGGGGGMNNMGGAMNMAGSGMNNMGDNGIGNMDGMMGGGNMGMGGNHMSGNMGGGPSMGHMGGMMNNQYGNMGGEMGGGGSGYGGYSDNTNFTAF